MFLIIGHFRASLSFLKRPLEKDEFMTSKLFLLIKSEASSRRHNLKNNDIIKSAANFSARQNIELLVFTSHL